jgi:hypothetical protein
MNVVTANKYEAIFPHLVNVRASDSKDLPARPVRVISLLKESELSHKFASDSLQCVELLGRALQYSKSRCEFSVFRMIKVLKKVCVKEGNLVVKLYAMLYEGCGKDGRIAFQTEKKVRTRCIKKLLKDHCGITGAFWYFRKRGDAISAGLYAIISMWERSLNACDQPVNIKRESCGWDVECFHFQREDLASSFSQYVNNNYPDFKVCIAENAGDRSVVKITKDREFNTLFAPMEERWGKVEKPPLVLWA